MFGKAFAREVEAAAIAVVVSTTIANAADFDWKKFHGQTISFLANSNPIGAAILKHIPEFEAKTGIKVVIDRYPEPQMRQRLLTALNARSDEFDAFMTLPSLEGLKFARSGWYTDLRDKVSQAPAEYEFSDLNKILVDAGTIDGRLTSVPINIDGPVLYYRKDLLRKCDLALPAQIAELGTVFDALKKCEPAIAPFVTRGLKAAAPYTFSAFLHNMGGHYNIADGAPVLCSMEGKAALALYAGLLRRNGPPGVVNASFYQVTDVYRSGRAAVAYESINQLDTIMENAARASDTGIALLPPGKGGSVPTVIGWGLAISAFSKKVDATWLFVQWATSPAVQTEIALDGVAVPRASIERSPRYKEWVAQLPVRGEREAVLHEMTSSGSSEIAIPTAANQQSREYIGQAINELLLQDEPVEQVCAKADIRLKELLKQD